MRSALRAASLSAALMLKGYDMTRCSWGSSSSTFGVRSGLFGFDTIDSNESAVDLVLVLVLVLVVMLAATAA